MPPVAKPKLSLKELIENGFLEPIKRGRPCVYKTDEERQAAHKAQQRECMKRHNIRLKEARTRMIEAEWDGTVIHAPEVVRVDACG
jgi:hypothetical protein